MMITIHYDKICPFRTTDKAWCVIWGSSLNETVRFLPKSQVEVDESQNTITLPEWLVVENRLDMYVD